MKNYLLLIFFLCSAFAFSQNKDSSDYFTVGLYTGNYVGRLPVYASNDIISSIALECEYFKTNELSFFVKFIHVITGSDAKKMYELPDDYIYTVDKKPTTYREVFSLGGRYYLRIKKINPYLQIGISEEFNLLNSFNITGVSTSQAYDSSFGHFKDIAYYKLSIFAGAGVNFKINNKVAIDIQYDVYLNIEKNDGNFIAHSVLVGLKYIL